MLLTAWETSAGHHILEASPSREENNVTTVILIDRGEH